MEKIMAAAFCNTCFNLVPLNGAYIKKTVCSCGNNNLVAVAGKWNPEKNGWDYFDRKGTFKIYIALTKTK